jgi:hypothetical protein
MIERKKRRHHLLLLTTDFGRLKAWGDFKLAILPFHLGHKSPLRWKRKKETAGHMCAGERCRATNGRSNLRWPPDAD